ncbi:MAG: phosphopantetheine-binding protein, partial [Bacteroidota bacterium]
NGDLEYFGNVDDLANFKGYQIDLSEIQQIIQGYENIEEAIVVDILTDKGEQELVAYYTTNSYVDEVELRNALQNLLPFYKAPNDYVKLDKLPYDEHGNIKRDALRKDAQSVTTESHSLSITEVELLEIWQDVLQRDEIDINDNFFKLGGHSLKAMKVLTTIKKKFGLKIKLSELFKQPTIKKLAASIDARKSQVESENSLLV